MLSKSSSRDGPTQRIMSERIITCIPYVLSVFLQNQEQCAYVVLSSSPDNLRWLLLVTSMLLTLNVSFKFSGYTRVSPHTSIIHG